MGTVLNAPSNMAFAFADKLKASVQSSLDGASNEWNEKASWLRELWQSSSGREKTATTPKNAKPGVRHAVPTASGAGRWRAEESARWAEEERQRQALQNSIGMDAHSVQPAKRTPLQPSPHT